MVVISRHIQSLGKQGIHINLSGRPGAIFSGDVRDHNLVEVDVTTIGTLGTVESVVGKGRFGV